MSTRFDIFHTIQTSLFPWLEETLDPLTKKERQFVQVLSLLDLHEHMEPYRRHKKRYMDPPTRKRFGQRSSVERVNGCLKDN